MKFSVITVCLNPGEKLDATLASVLEQTFEDAEVVLKDGGSKDGSVERWKRENASHPGFGRVRVLEEKDKGIYDAMNQAAAHALGEFLIFLNCGDVFPDKRVLERTAEVLAKEERMGTDMDSATATSPATSPVSTARRCAEKSPMTCNTRSGRIMIIFYGASIGQEPRCCP